MNTIPIKKIFSILNESYPQIILKFTNDEYYSISINNDYYKAFKVDYNNKTNSVINIYWGSEINRNSFSSIRTAIWNKVNNIK